MVLSRVCVVVDAEAFVGGVSDQGCRGYFGLKGSADNNLTCVYSCVAPIYVVEGDGLKAVDVWIGFVVDLDNVCEVCQSCK